MTTHKLRVRQAIVISLLFGGYASLYFCRADLSVATPLLARELGRHGISYDDALVRIGAITSLGILAYALGKPFIGGLGDYWGGRINFLVGLAGATLCDRVELASVWLRDNLREDRDPGKWPAVDRRRGSPHDTPDPTRRLAGAYAPRRVGA